MELSATGVRMTHEGYFLRVPERGVHALTSRVTEEENLFLLAHMGLAEVDPTDWRLRVAGLIREPASLGLADLSALPPHEVMSVHECAGSPLTPTFPKRRVGNVVWSGVRLRDVLELCRVASEAAFVWTHGLERGDFADLKGEPYVSTNGGAAWTTATLEPHCGFAWQHFSVPWVVPASRHHVTCRCFDWHGVGQPESGARNAIHSLLLGDTI